MKKTEGVICLLITYLEDIYQETDKYYLNLQSDFIPFQVARAHILQLQLYEGKTLCGFSASVNVNSNWGLIPNIFLDKCLSTLRLNIRHLYYSYRYLSLAYHHHHDHFKTGLA